MTEFTPEWIEKARKTGRVSKPKLAENLCKALDEITRLQSRVQELEAEQRWIPVSERLPVEDDYYSVAFRLPNNQYVTDIYYYLSATEHKWFIRNDAYRIATFFDRVTHWRPLPQQPKEGANE